MAENEKNIGKKYLKRASNDNNIYVIEKVEKNNYILGPYLQPNSKENKLETITCECTELGDLYEEFIE